MERVYNFSAGPSMMPVEILQQAKEDLISYPGAGCSAMEMSHRSAAFEKIIADAESSLRRLMHIPDDYAVLFLQGGASMQFSAVPMNLARQGQTTNYAVTGQFAGKALAEGERWGKAVAVTSSKADTFSYIPKITPELLSPDAAYLHITGNNTIFGTCYNTLEREVDPIVPTMLRYKVMAENHSMYNTPPCFSIYMAGLMFQWVEKMGGVAAMEQRNREKAALLYDLIEQSEIFQNPVAKEDRSIMNVTFTLPTPEDTKAFLQMAQGRGMINLKGHRSVGGCRASIYNGMPKEGVEALAACMRDYEAGLRK